MSGFSRTPCDRETVLRFRSDMRKLLLLCAALLVSASALAPVGSASPAQSAASPLPMPTFHHIHINSVNPEAALAWYSQFWPRGERTTFGGFPAFHDEIYLLYTKVPSQAPGAFDAKRQRSVPQSAFWTFGSTFTDTVDVRAAVEAGSQAVPVPAGLHRARR